jgi:GTP cyclohydrolase I
VTLNMPAGILREVTRDDSSERMTRPAPDIGIPAPEEAVRSLLVALGQDPEAEHLRQMLRRVAAFFGRRVWGGPEGRALVHVRARSKRARVAHPDMELSGHLRAGRSYG